MKGDPWRCRSVAVIGALALWHIVAGVFVDLGDAEALYFCYGLHLQGGYLDHPPMIGWLIAAATWLFGDFPGAVRVVPTLCHAAMLWGGHVLGRDCFGSDRAGFFAVATLALIPMMTIGGIAAAPDAPASALWIWTAVALGRTFRKRRKGEGAIPWWEASLIGALIGLTFLAKYTGILLIPGALLLYRQLDSRKRGKGSLFIAGTTCLLTTAPVAVWNAHNGWASLMHRLVWSHNNSLPFPSLTTLGSTIGGQLLYLGPPMALGLVWGFWELARKRKDPEQHLLFSLSIPALIFTYALCLWSPAAEPHWPAQGYLTLAVGLGGLLSQRSAWTWWIKATIWAAIALISVVFVVLHIVIFTTALPELLGPERYERRYDLTNELLGWPEVATAALEVRDQDEPLAGSHYTICSQLRFALARVSPGVTPRVLCLSPEVDDFDLWREGSLEGVSSVIYVEDDRFGTPSEDVFQSTSWELSEIGSVEISRRRWVVRRFRFIRASRIE